MKIYFAASIRGGRDDSSIYKEIVVLLSQHGDVLTEHVGSTTLSQSGEALGKDRFIFERDVRLIAEADVFVAEVTTPSLGVGYEIGKAESLGKPILCLYRLQEGKLLSSMVAGNPKVHTEVYADASAASSIFQMFFKSL